MKDIVEITDGSDILVQDSVVGKAGNSISVQLGSLEYAQDLGVDLKYFLSSDLQFQNDSFKAYLIQRLTEQQVNVAQVMDVLERHLQSLTFYVGDQNKNVGGLIR